MLLFGRWIWPIALHSEHHSAYSKFPTQKPYGIEDKTVSLCLNLVAYSSTSAFFSGSGPSWAVWLCQAPKKSFLYLSFLGCSRLRVGLWITSTFMVWSAWPSGSPYILKSKKKNKKNKTKQCALLFKLSMLTICCSCNSVVLVKPFISAQAGLF